MTEKTYRATSLALALAEVKRELGATAVILRTRSYRAGGFLGVGAHEIYEITAAADFPHAELKPLAASSASESERPSNDTNPLENSELPYAGDRARALVTKTAFAPVDASAARAIKSELDAIRRLVAKLRRVARPPQLASVPGGIAEPFLEWLDCLRIANVPDDVAIEVVAEAQGASALVSRTPKEAIVEALATRLPAADVAIPNGEPLLVAIIGPTGVGKTTTLAKLAAMYRLQHQSVVGFLACDTYRIGAVEQLRTYARILDAPFAVASTPADIQEARDSLAGCDVILIDTAGRSQQDAVRIAQTGEFLETLRPQQTHLVVSAAAATDAACRAIDTFGTLGADRLIFSKLDEAESLGPLVGLARRAGLPLSYLATGQEVPDDLHPANSRLLASAILDASLDPLLYT